MPSSLVARIHAAIEKYESPWMPLNMMEIFRRAWKSYQKGNVDPELSGFAPKYAKREKGKKEEKPVSYKHDLGKDVPSRLLVRILDVYLNSYGV